MSRQNNNSGRIKTIAVSGIVAMTVLGLSGCNQYLDRQDPITLSAGDSIAQAKVAHTIHTWPRGSEDPHHTTDGSRAMIAIERYKKNESIEPEQIRAQEISKGEK